MSTKQYNSPLGMYSEDLIEEIMTQVDTIRRETTTATTTTTTTTINNQY